MSKYNKQIGVNSMFSIVKIVVTMAAFFLYYRYLIKEYGTEFLGLWSVTLAIASLINIGGSGVGSGLLKFGAELDKQKDYKNLSSITNYSLLIFITLSAIFGFFLFLFNRQILNLTIDLNKEWLEKGITIFPYLIVSMIVSMVGRTLFSLIDSINKSYIHTIIQTIGIFVFVFFGLYFINDYGILGMAYAHLIQSITYLLLGIIFLKIKIPNYSFKNYSWNKEIMRKLIIYNFNFQVSSVFQLLFDPLNKFLFTKFGGLELTAYYEIANKIISTIRGLITSVLNNFIPKIAILGLDQNRASLIKQFKLIKSLNIIFSTACIFSIVFLSTIFSSIFFNELNFEFIRIFQILSIAWFINTLSVPEYYMNMGSGKLKPNTFSVIIQSFLNLIFGLTIGVFFGNEYISISVLLAFSVGAFYLIKEYHSRYKIAIQVSKKDKLLFFIGFVLLIINVFFYYQSPYLLPIVLLVVFLVVFFCQKKELFKIFLKTIVI